MIPGRPQPSEYPPYATRYVDLVSGNDPVAALKSQIQQTVALFRSLPEQAGDARYASGKWTIKEMLLHMVDTERIMATRLLRIARGDATPQPSFEQDLYVPNSGANARTLASILAEFETVRAGTVALVEELPSEAWGRQGTMSSFSATPLGLAFLIAGHELAHVAILRERYLPALA